MRKKISFLLIFILWAMCISALSGCNHEETFTARSYVCDGGAAEKIIVDVRDRSVNIGVSDDGKIHINCHESEKEYYEISVENGILTVSLVCDKDWTDYIGTKPNEKYRVIDVEIPDGSLTEIDVITTNGDIMSAPIQILNGVSFDTNGGNIVIDALSVGCKAQFTAKNGNITGSLAGSMSDFSVSCKIKKGDSNLPEDTTGGTKFLTATCNNGDISISFV